MSKNDLIEKMVRAQKVKSQTTPAPAPAPARPRPEDRREEPREGDGRNQQQRIASGTGVVVVRRRSRPEDALTPPGPSSAAPPVYQVPPARVATPEVRQETVAEVAPRVTRAPVVEPPPSRPAEPEQVETRSVAPVEADVIVNQPEVVASPVVVEVIPAPPEPPPPAPPAPVQVVAPTPPPPPPPRQPAQPAHQPQAPSHGQTQAQAAAAAAARRDRSESAKVIYRPERPSSNPTVVRRPDGSANVSAAPEKRETTRGHEQPEPRSQSNARPGPRSLEDVLAQEHGYVPVQRRAIVVAQRPEAPPEPRPTGATVVSAPGGAQAQQGGAGQRQQQEGAAQAKGAAAQPSARPNPNSIKEIAREDRARKGGARGPAGPEERDRGVVKGKKAKKDKVVPRRVGDFSTIDDGTVGGRRRKGPAAVRKELKKTQLTTPKAIKRVIEMEEYISVADLAHRMEIKSALLIKKLMDMGVMATLNQQLDHDTAALVASEFGYEVKDVAFDETEYIPEVEDAAEQLFFRPPVVTIMGHVDHGKTTLLDAIRSARVAEGEAGGITQHIGAYKVQTEKGTIVFLDTPGHEAFTSMRARGAQVTDIVVLVVAADDGVMPQTLEALNHAKAAEVPVIVAINKIDKPGAQPDVIKRKLAEHGLIPEEWGGQTIFAPVSAKKRTGIEDLLDLILLQAEVLELKANPDRSARAAVIEAKLDRGRGPVASVLVQVGTLRVGDFVVVGQHFGKIRAMIDDAGGMVDEAGPSIPVQLLGLSGVPEAGDQMAVVEDIETAKEIAEERAMKARQRSMAETSKVSLEDLFKQMKDKEVEEVRVIVKADFQGSVEALVRAFENLPSEKVRLKIIHAAVGGVNESDIMLADTLKAMVVAFNVVPDARMTALADQLQIELRSYAVIYDAVDDVRKAMEGRLAPVYREKLMGQAEVRDIFAIPKVGVIAGCMVVDGKVARNCLARLVRDGTKLWEGKLTSLKRFRDDAREVEKGFECGIGLENFNDILPGDIIVSFTNEEMVGSL